MAGKCVFCRRDLTGFVSEEHIFGRWLLKHLGIPQQDQMFQGVADYATLDTDRVQNPRTHGTWRFVDGRVCQPCNNGWLDRLDQDTRPGLEMLIREAGRVVALSPPQCSFLARWAAKTAFLIANVSPFKQPVPPGHLLAMNNGGPVPEGVFVFAGQSGTTTNTAYFQSSQWPHFSGNRLDAIGTFAGAYKIGFQVRDLLLLVAFVPKSGIEFVTAAGVHIPLNPRLPVFPSYVAPMPDDPQPPLWTFTRLLAALLR
jgi:hypothetical protein